MKTCNKCYGKGTNLKQTECYTCYGSGVTSQDCPCRYSTSHGLPDPICPLCHGDSKYDGDCPVSNCDRGRVPEERTCDKCYGSGQVEDDDSSDW